MVGHNGKSPSHKVIHISHNNANQETPCYSSLRSITKRSLVSIIMGYVDDRMAGRLYIWWPTMNYLPVGVMHFENLRLAVVHETKQN